MFLVYYKRKVAYIFALNFAGVPCTQSMIFEYKNIKIKLLKYQTTQVLDLIVSSSLLDYAINENKLLKKLRKILQIT